jgi:LmbE family N-acetylglucosaminyl deacetylase
VELRGARILAVVAHPDDETIGCGGLLARAARSGAECRVLLPLRRGDQRGLEHWRDILDHFRSACGILGAEPVVVEDGAVVDVVADTRVDEVRAAVEPWVDRADVVLTHHPGDVHQAHRAVSRAVEIATRPFRRRRAVAFFEVASSTDQAYAQTFQPNLFVTLEDADAERKCAAMAAYATEQAPGRTPADLRLRLAHRGLQINCAYAEAFAIARCFL